MAETSDTRFLNTCRRLLDIFRADPKWNPSNQKLLIVALEAKLAAGYPIAADVETKLAPQKIKINQRQTVYEKIPGVVRATRLYLKSSGATGREIADAQSYFRPLLGIRAAPKTVENPDVPAGKAVRAHSVSQLSFDSQYGNLIALRQFLGNVSSFDPNETEIKLTAYDDLIQQTDEANAAVSTGFVPLLQAWNLRDAKLYNDADSIINDFRDAKDYYKSLYLPKSPEYRAVTALTLTDNSRR